MSTKVIIVRRKIKSEKKARPKSRERKSRSRSRSRSKSRSQSRSKSREAFRVPSNFQLQNKRKDLTPETKKKELFKYALKHGFADAGRRVALRVSGFGHDYVQPIPATVVGTDEKRKYIKVQLDNNPDSKFNEWKFGHGQSPDDLGVFGGGTYNLKPSSMHAIRGDKTTYSSSNNGFELTNFPHHHSWRVSAHLTDFS